MGNVTPHVFAFSGTSAFFSGSSHETPTNATLSPTFFESSSSFGIDLPHGSHHVAQKSTTTGFPCRPSSLTLPLPLTVSSSKVGAADPISRLLSSPPPDFGALAFLFCGPHAPVNATTQNEARTKQTTFLMRSNLSRRRTSKEVFHYSALTAMQKKAPLVLCSGLSALIVLG